MFVSEQHLNLVRLNLVRCRCRVNRLPKTLDKQGYFIVVREKSGAVSSGVSLAKQRSQNIGASIFSREHELALGNGGLKRPIFVQV